MGFNVYTTCTTHCSPDKKTGPVNGDECYFWRNTGCHFGDRCFYRHVPKHQGIDLKSERKHRGHQYH